MTGKLGIAVPLGGNLADQRKTRGRHPVSPLPEESVLYGIDRDGFIKIGVSDYPVRRMRDLQCANPHPLRIVLFWRIPKPYRLEIEMLVHELLRDPRVRNERFKVTQAEAAYAGERAVYLASMSRGDPKFARTVERPLTFLAGELEPLAPSPVAEAGR